MPVDNGVRRYNDERFAPRSPNSGKHNPEESIHHSNLRPLVHPFHYDQLLAKRKVLSIVLSPLLMRNASTSNRIPTPATTRISIMSILNEILFNCEARSFSEPVTYIQIGFLSKVICLKWASQLCFLCVNVTTFSTNFPSAFHERIASPRIFWRSEEWLGSLKSVVPLNELSR